LSSSRLKGRDENDNPALNSFCSFPPKIRREPSSRLVDTIRRVCSYRHVKLLAALAILTAFCFSSCTTLANRRDLYRPNKANGPWTKKIEKGPHTLSGRPV
jgi:hypothetical protein